MNNAMRSVARYVLYAVLALVLTTVVAVVLIVKLVLAPSPGEWPERVKWGPLAFDVSAPTVIRLLTVSWFAPRLDGVTLGTRLGDVVFGWDDATQHLTLQCAPCSAMLPGAGRQPVQVARLSVAVKRQVANLDGRLQLVPTGAAAAPIEGHWSGTLSQTGMEVKAEMPDTSIAQWYAVLAPTLPELQRARISGTVDLRARLSLPSQAYVVQPRPDEFKVSGLDAKALLVQRGTCGPPSRLHNDSWVARAVVAAQDPDFFQHDGLEPRALADLLTSPPPTDKAGHPKAERRTISEQAAELIAPTGAPPLVQRLREWLFAAELESTMDKAALLQGWLDNAPWGESLCGVEPAARFYFGRSAAKLQAPQAVWLATLQADPADGLAAWRRDGQLDPARTKAVSERISGVNYRQRDALIRSVAAARYPPP